MQSNSKFDVKDYQNMITAIPNSIMDANTNSTTILNPSTAITDTTTIPATASIISLEFNYAPDAFSPDTNTPAYLESSGSVTTEDPCSVSTNINVNSDNTMNILKDIFDGFSYKILFSTIEESKTVCDISKENDLPISSTYKKIRRLKELGLLIIDKININEQGKKVIFYKSKISSMEVYLNKSQVILNLYRNGKNLKF